MTLEIERRRVGGVWRTGAVDDPGGGGGSQTYKFSVSFADLKENGDELTLLTPAAGDVLVNGFIDPETAVDWVTGGSPDMAINEDPPGPDYDNNVGFMLFDPTTIEPSHTGSAPKSIDNGASGLTGVSGFSTSQRVFHGGSIKIGYVDSGFGTAEAGSFDLYLVIATPVTP